MSATVAPTRPPIERDPKIFPLKDGMTYRNGFGDLFRVGGRAILTGEDEIAWTIQGVWFRRMDGRHCLLDGPEEKPTPYDLAVEVYCDCGNLPEVGSRCQKCFDEMVQEEVNHR